MANQPQKSEKTDDFENGKTPWSDAHPRVTVSYRVVLSDAQHRKLTWLAENLPGRQSISKLIHAGINAEIARHQGLFDEYFKP